MKLGSFWPYDVKLGLLATCFRIVFELTIIDFNCYAMFCRISLDKDCMSKDLGKINITTFSLPN